MVEQKFEGRGIGEKTLAQVAKENNLDLDAMKKRLSAQGLTLQEGEKIRQLADRQKTKTIPIQILKMALVDKTQVPKEEPKETAPVVKAVAPAPKAPSPTTPSPVEPAPSVSPKSAIPAAPTTPKVTGYTEEMVKTQFEGKGIGEKTLAQVVKENNLDMNYINERLVAKNLSIKEDETLRQMAARYNTTPIELMKMVLVENPDGK
jgi:hypothetical protein